MKAESLAGAKPKPVMWKGRYVGLKYISGAWLCYHTGCIETRFLENARRGQMKRTECKRCGKQEDHPRDFSPPLLYAYFGPDVRPWDARRRD